MKAFKISYSRGYPIGPYLQEKPGIEAELEEGEDPIKALQELKAMTERFHREGNPGLYDGVVFEEGKAFEVIEPGIATKVSSKDKQIASFVEAISGCTSMKALEIFAKLVERENIDVLYEAYHNKKKELENG